MVIPSKWNLDLPYQFLESFDLPCTFNERDLSHFHTKPKFMRLMKMVFENILEINGCNQCFVILPQNVLLPSLNLNF